MQRRAQKSVAITKSSRRSNSITHQKNRLTKGINTTGSGDGHLNITLKSPKQNASFKQCGDDIGGRYKNLQVQRQRTYKCKMGADDSDIVDIPNQVTYSNSKNANPNTSHI